MLCMRMLVGVYVCIFMAEDSKKSSNTLFGEYSEYSDIDGKIVALNFL